MFNKMIRCLKNINLGYYDTIFVMVKLEIQEIEKPILKKFL